LESILPTGNTSKTQVAACESLTNDISLPQEDSCGAEARNNMDGSRYVVGLCRHASNIIIININSNSNSNSNSSIVSTR